MIKFEFESMPEISLSINHKIWIIDSIRNENKIPGDLSYLFCSDEYMISQNIQFLNHDTYTDIITFDESIGDIINGSVLISVDRIMENAKSYNSTIESELLRLLIHGALHLCGYKDKTDEEQKVMRLKENEYISKFICGSR